MFVAGSINSWLFAIRCVSFVACFVRSFSPVACLFHKSCSLCVARVWLFVACCSLFVFVVCLWLIVACRLLCGVLAFSASGLVCDVWCVGVGCLLFVVCCLLLLFVCCVLVLACRNCALCWLYVARCLLPVA